MAQAPRLPLSPDQRLLRAAGSAAILGFIVYSWVLNPQSVSTFNLSAFRNIIGLPCPLCGGTRATHYLLQGDLTQALYYNWLALPAFLGGMALVLIFGWELLRDRAYLPIFRLSKRIWAAAIIFVIAIWAYHIYDALHTPKLELLNSRGLYFQLQPNNSNP